jgi:hypothetical protein
MKQKITTQEKGKQLQKDLTSSKIKKGCPDSILLNPKTETYYLLSDIMKLY